MPPTQPVSHHPTIISNTISPVHSQYPSPSTPPPSLREKERRTPSPRRPPPLDLNKTKTLYPSAPAENSPDVNVLPVREKAAKPRTVVDDPFDVAEVEPGHRYTSWKGGKVGIKPGQVIPRSLLRVPSEMPITRLKTEPESPDQYDSVLYNVLLTPTYLGHSPLPVPSSSPSPLASSSNPKRRSLIDRATDTIHHVARMSRHPGWVGKGILKHRDEEVGRSVREMREREQREMERFRNATRMGRLGSGALVAGRSYSPLPEISCAYPRRSPGQREWRVGGALGLSCTAPNDESGKKVEREWRVMKKEEDRIKRRQRIWKVCQFRA